MKKMRRICMLATALFLFVLNGQIAYGWPSVYPTGVTIHDPEQAYEGYTLFVPINLFSVEDVKLIDMEGNLVHSWDLSPTHVHYIKPLPGGRIMGLDPTWGRLVEADWEGQILWSFQTTEYEMHHDFQRLDNGNTLIAAKQKLWLPIISLFPFYYDLFIEMSPHHETVWNWYSWNHFGDFGFSAEARAWIYFAKIIYVFPDAFHTNSIQSLPPNRFESDARFQRGNILMSQRNTNIIFIIDKDSGEIVWKVGPKNNLTVGQHDAHMIEEGLPGAGNILVFDNGGGAGYPTKTREYSRVLEIDPLTKDIVWKYNAMKEGKAQYAFFSHIISGAQRLPNGNTLICEGAFGRIFEVTPAGKTVWEYVEANPPQMIFRAYRMGLDWPPSAP